MMNRLDKKQQGVFAVEFALVSLFFTMLLVLSGDLATKLSMRGKLDRLSYSMVNLVKERTELAESDFSVFDPTDTTSDLSTQKIFYMVRNSLYRTMNQNSFEPQNLVVLVEQLNTQADGTIEKSTDYSRAIVGSLANESPLTGEPLYDYANSVTTTLAPLTVLNRRSILYQVSICYKTDDWYGNYIDNLTGNEYGSFEWVCSNSLSLAR